MSEPLRPHHSSVIAAVIVLYQPEKQKLTKLIESILNDTNKIILIDNSYSQLDLDSLFFKNNYPEAIYLNFGQNMGIAKAQNKGIDLAREAGCDHVIFFDQDSKPSSGMIQALLKEESLLLANQVKLGAIGPRYIDEKTNKVSKAVQFFAGALLHRKWNNKNSSSIRADFIISSGSLIRISVLNDVGPMYDELFIDGVDVDWVLRASIKGYYHYMVKGALMTHNIGESFVRIGFIKVTLHKELRNYYKIRNLCFLVSHRTLQWRFVISMFYRIPLYLLIYILLSPSKIDAIRLYYLACCSGFYGNLGKVDLA